MILQNIKNLLGINNQDEVIHQLLNICNSKILTYLNLKELPIELEWILIEMTIARFNRIGSEGVETESVDGKQTKYIDDLAPYKSFLDKHIKHSTTEKGFKLL